jgi:hypothetical protein
MKATDSFDRNYLIILKCLADVLKHFLIMKKRQDFAIFVEGKRWSTAVTGDSLGMKTAISWVGVFFLAVWTHYEITHRRSRTIIRTGFCHGEAWATRRTSEKKIVMSAILWISEFFETIVTEKYIWWNLTKTITSTFPNRKVSKLCANRFGLKSIDAHVSWELDKDILESFGIIHDHHGTFSGILYKSQKTSLGAGVVNEWPKSNALNNTLNGEAKK